MAKTSKRKRPAEQEADELAGEKRGQPSKPNRTPRDTSAALGMVSDNEDDPARLESQQFLAMTKAFQKQQTSKKGDYLAEFRDRVRMQREKLVTSHKKTSEELSTHFTASQSILQGIISASLVKSTSGTSTISALLPADPATASRITNIRSTAILALCRLLLERHDTSTRHIKDAGTSVAIGQVWKQDHQDVKNQLEMGGKAAKTQIGKLLDYPDHIAENREVEKLAMFDNSEEADLVLSMGRKADGEGGEPSKGGTWAVTAHRVEKDVRHLIRKIPTHE